MRLTTHDRATLSEILAILEGEGELGDIIDEAGDMLAHFLSTH